MSNEFTSSIDLAQVVLYLFWVFFAGLIYWLRREDRREGYPVEAETVDRVMPENSILIPPPKQFLLADGTEIPAPAFGRDRRALQAERVSRAAGSPLEPIGDPLLSGVGPAAYAERHDVPELTIDGSHAIVPMRVATDYSVSAGPDPRGWDVLGVDGQVAGTVVDIWVDRSDMMVRYLEVQIPLPAGVVATAPSAIADAPTEAAVGEGQGSPGDSAAPAAAPAPVSPRRLLPITMLLVDGDKRRVEVDSLKAAQLSAVPSLRQPDRVTLLEEERIGAFYAGGRLYADPKRVESVL